MENAALITSRLYFENAVYTNSKRKTNSEAYPIVERIIMSSEHPRYHIKDVLQEGLNVHVVTVFIMLNVVVFKITNSASNVEIVTSTRNVIPSLYHSNFTGLGRRQEDTYNKFL